MMMMMVMVMPVMMRRRMVLITSTAEDKPLALLCPLPAPDLIILTADLELGICYFHCTNGETEAQ